MFLLVICTIFRINKSVDTLVSILFFLPKILLCWTALIVYIVYMTHNRMHTTKIGSYTIMRHIPDDRNIHIFRYTRRYNQFLN
jgi:hypothetical protein